MDRSGFRFSLRTAFPKCRAEKDLLTLIFPWSVLGLLPALGLVGVYLIEDCASKYAFGEDGSFVGIFFWEREKDFPVLIVL